VGTFPVHTAMPLPKIDGEGADIDIDFINEMLVLSGGLNFENCAVTISGDDGNLPIPPSTASRYGVGSYADKGDFTVSVVRKGVLIPGTGDMYPDSRCVEVFFNGRNEAPEVIARYASTDLSEDGGIEKTSGGAFQYRIAGSGNGGWRNANNRVNTLGINNYEVRTAPNTSAFASKVATVSITPKSLAIEVSSIEQKGGAKGRAATKGLLITFNRPVTGLPADALTLAGPATIGTVTDNGDADAATWFVNIVPTANEGDGSTQIQVTVKNWGYNDQQYTVAAGSEKAVTIYIPKPEQMPAAGIDYEQERLTGLTPGAQYKFGAEGVGSGAITMPDAGTEFPIHESWMTGQANGFSLVRAGGEASVDSAPQLLTIPARRPAPTLEINQPTAAGAEATVSGVNADMEYQSVPPTDSNNWESVADSNITLDLGVYYVRRKANVSAKEFPSAAALVRIYKYGEINFGDALQGYTIGSENGPPASLPVKPATSAGENMSTITDVKWVDSAGNLLEDDAVDELPFVLEGEGKNWSVKLKSDTTLSPGEYAAKIKITYEGEKDNTSIQNVCFNIHHKAEIKKVTTQANGYGLTNELQIKFEYPIALTFADIAVDGAAVKSGTGFTDTDATTPRETYTLAIEPLMGVKKGTSVKVSINVGALGPDYAYQLAHGDGVLQNNNTRVTIPRAIARASVSPPPLPPAAGYSTNYVQFTLAPGPEHFPIDVNALREHPDSVVFKYTDGTELMPTDIRRVDADPSGLTFRAFITPVQTGSVTISISDFGVEAADVEGEIKATELRAGAGYYLDENGNNYLVTLEEAFQVLPSRVYGGDGQEYEAAKYLLRTDADADEWKVSAVYIDGAPITVTGYSEQIALNQPYFFDGESKGPIARQLCVMLQEGWTEANGEHRVVVVLKGRGDPAAVVMIGGKIGVSGLTPRYTLTVEGGAGGGRYPAGRAVAISANAPPSGKAFYKWTLRETDGGAFGNAYAASTSFTMPAGNATVAAEYRDRHATPAARINYENETLENLIPGATYTWTHKSVLTGTFTATDGVYAIKGTWMTATGADGENFSLVRNADENNAASLPQDLRIPARVSAPGVLGQPESFAGFGDGKLIDLNGEMEYRADTDPDTYWVRVEPGAVESENLAPGNYLVRYRADTGAKRFAGKSVTVTVAPSGVTPTWRISVAPASAEIPKAAYGYAAPTPVTVTVTNTGNQPTGELTVTLTDEKTAAFTLGGLETDHTIGNIPINGKVTFTVAPNTGLAADTYSATVTVAASAGNTLPTEYGQTLGGALDTVDFTVSKAAITGFASLSLINAGTADEIESEDGGGVHGKYKPEIINDTLMSEFPDVTAYYAGSD
ncbi:MAG: hypothetical protein LBH86_09100, partial [Oscillospiraceae bacterium]|nr:hypothetical protein [Oscillospiraceae bacterium]